MGFTLIEALVAISILMIAVASPITMAQKSLVASMFSRDQMIATFLAQDALEGIKNARDQIAMNGTSTDSWLKGLENCICDPIASQVCDFNNNNVKSCNINTTKTLSDGSDYISSFASKSAILPVEALYEGTSPNRFFKMFTLSGGEPTKFKRAINIELNPNRDSTTGGFNSNEARVQVRVFWDSQMGEKKIDVTLYIYNYEPKFKI
jgi:type II secretory pathway pseudopilin PulG